MTRLLAASCLLLFLGLEHAQGAIIGTLDVSSLQSGVVRITANPSGEPQKVGTGFIVRLERDIVYIVTAAHVIAGDFQPKVQFFTQQDLSIQATVKHSEGGDEVTGLALLIVRGTNNLPSGLKALTLASVSQATVNEQVILIGHPRGAGDWAILKGGIASRLGRYLTVDANIDEGNSGGPIISGGEVVGVIGGVARYGRGVTASSVRDYLEGHGVDVSKPSVGPSSLKLEAKQEKPSAKFGRTVQVPEKFGNNVQLVYYKSKDISLQQVPLESVMIAVFDPRHVMLNSKVGRDAITNWTEFASLGQASLNADAEDINSLREQMSKGNRIFLEKLREKWKQYKLHREEFEAGSKEHQKILADLSAVRMEIAVRLVAERDHWNLILDNLDTFKSNSGEIKDLLPNDVRELLRRKYTDITSSVIEEFDRSHID